MKYFEENGLNCDFKRYRELKITPFQVHRSKEEHKQAIFVLASELASMTVKKLEPEGGSERSFIVTITVHKAGNFHIIVAKKEIPRLCPG